MKWKSLIVCAAALTGFSALNAQTPSASASGSASVESDEHHRWGHHHEFGFFLKQLNLTDTQKQQVKQYFSDNKQAFKTNMLNLLKAKQAVDSAIEKNPSDESTIRSLSANVASAQTELSAQRAKFHVFLQSILTSEQKQTLTTLQQKRDAKIQEHISRLSQSGS
ncbi:MAG: periplasmic heavy metal sensor [Verrucomicrobia bacterium]|nr:periplasmic heavy metal sensor [Verrucomicrobiota bacterium]